MREYLNITDELDKYDVGVVSLCEPFNTETKEGRMMRNNLLNFAEFERETIAARVKDAYDTKAMGTGFYQGGKVYFGFDISRRTIKGKTGSVLVPSEAAQTIITAFEMYKEPDVSLADVCKYIQENNLPTTSTEHGEKITLSVDTACLSQLLKNPMYVRADKEVYRYLMSKGFNMIDDIEDTVYKAMVEHISEFKITKSKTSKSSTEIEKIKAEILRIETETRKLIDRLPDADNVLFEYIQGRITELHTAKQEYENKLLNVERNVKQIDTKPLIDPLNRWDELTRNEQNDVARIMIDKVLISDETGIDIHFSF